MCRAFIVNQKEILCLIICILVLDVLRKKKRHFLCRAFIVNQKEIQYLRTILFSDILTLKNI